MLLNHPHRFSGKIVSYFCDHQLILLELKPRPGRGVSGGEAGNLSFTRAPQQEGINWWVKCCNTWMIVVSRANESRLMIDVNELCSAAVLNQQSHSASRNQSPLAPFPMPKVNLGWVWEAICVRKVGGAAHF